MKVTLMYIFTVYQKVASFFRHNPGKTVRDTATELGLSKSAIDRHRQSMKRKQTDETTAFLESDAGYIWIRHFIFGVLFFFGIQRGIGAESLSFFFEKCILSTTLVFLQDPSSV